MFQISTPKHTIIISFSEQVVLSHFSIHLFSNWLIFISLSFEPQCPKKFLFLLSSILLKTTVLHKFLLCVCVVSHIQLSSTPFMGADQAPLSMEFSRQECWSWWSCPPPGDLPDPGIKPVSLKSPALAGWFFTTGATWETPKDLYKTAQYRKISTFSLMSSNRMWVTREAKACHLLSLYLVRVP